MPRLQHVAGRVWIWPHHPDPAVVQGCVGVIVDDRGSVVVDAGRSPAAAWEIQAEIRTAGLPTPRWLVYTHHHWDHVWGACAWPEVEVVGQELGAGLLEAERARPWSHDYLRAEMTANPRLEPSFTARASAMDTWAGFEIVVPHRTFSGSLVLPTGVELRHVGGQHAPDSTVVVVPDSSVMMLGDAIYPPPLHLRSPDDGLDLAMTRALLAEGHDWYVEAHGEPRLGSLVAIELGL